MGGVMMVALLIIIVNHSRINQRSVYAAHLDKDCAPIGWKVWKDICTLNQLNKKYLILLLLLINTNILTIIKYQFSIHYL